MPNRENNVSRAGDIREHVGKLENIVSAAKMFLNLLGNIFAFYVANSMSTIMFPEVGKQENIDRKHNVSATMFPSLPRTLEFTHPSIQNTHGDDKKIYWQYKQALRFIFHHLFTATDVNGIPTN